MKKRIIILFLSLTIYSSASSLYGGCYTFKYKYKTAKKTVCFISEEKIEENNIMLDEAKEEDLLYKKQDNITSEKMLDDITTKRYKALWATYYDHRFSFQYKYNKGYIWLSGYGDEYLKAQIKALEYEDEIYRIKNKLSKKAKKVYKKPLTNRENIMKFLNKEMNR